MRFTRGRYLYTLPTASRFLSPAILGIDRKRMQRFAGIVYHVEVLRSMRAVFCGISFCVVGQSGYRFDGQA